MADQTLPHVVIDGNPYYYFRDVYKLIKMFHLYEDGIDCYYSIPAEFRNLSGDEPLDDETLPLVSENGLTWIIAQVASNDALFWRERYMKMLDAATYRSSNLSELTEKDVEDALCRSLDRQRVDYERQVPCDYGIIDVLTTDTIYEVKRSISTHSIKRAIGQLLFYGKCYSKHSLVLAFHSTNDNFANLSLAATRFKVKLIQIKVDKGGHHDR